MNIDESRTAKGFTRGSQVPNRTIREIFIHHWGVRGQTHDGVVNFFCTGPGTTSAHFVVSGGRTNCIVSPADVAWHAGSWDANVRSVGIECRPEATDEDYREVAALVRWLRSQHGDLPLVPHRAVKATACPGVWDLARIDREARGITVPKPAAPVAQPGANQFRVDAGDTLGGIAKQFNVTLESLIAANPGIDPNRIYPGQILNFGKVNKVPYCIVESGDTLGGIAKQFGVTLQRILSVNPGINANRIYPGQRINL